MKRLLVKISTLCTVDVNNMQVRQATGDSASVHVMVLYVVLTTIMLMQCMPTHACKLMGVAP